MNIVDMKGFKAVGFQVQGDWQTLPEVMPKKWEEFYKKSGSIKNKVKEGYMDISLSETDGVYTQFICAEVSDFDEIPDGFACKEIPEGKYLHYTHTVRVEEIYASFEEMYSFAEAHGHKVTGFKIDYGYEEGGTESEHELYIRVIE